MEDDGTTHEFRIPRMLASGASNSVFTVLSRHAHSDTRAVQRLPTRVPDPLDLRVLTDEEIRVALAAHYPGGYASLRVSAPPPVNGQAMLRLQPGPEEVDEHVHDQLMESLIEELGYLSHHSEDAAHSLLPRQDAGRRALTSLPEDMAPVRCDPTAGDAVFNRAFTIRVAEMVTRSLGRPLARKFGLPTPKQLAKGMPQPVPDSSSLVVFHGDPILANLMWDGPEPWTGAPILTDFEMGRVAGHVSAAGGTLATLVTRCAYPLRPERREQFRAEVRGAEEAIRAGVYRSYLADEFGRSAFSDVHRALRGTIPVALAHRNLQRYLESVGAPVISLERFSELVEEHGGDSSSFPLPTHAPLMEPTQARAQASPVAAWTMIVAVHDEVTGAAEASLPPELAKGYRRMLAQIGPPPPGSVLEVAARLRAAGRTEVRHEFHRDHERYTFVRPEHGTRRSETASPAERSKSRGRELGSG